MMKKIKSVIFILFTIGSLYYMSKGLVGIAAAYALIITHLVRVVVKIYAIKLLTKKLKIRDDIKEEFPRKFGHLELSYLTCPMIYFSFKGTIHMPLFILLGLLVAFIMKQTGLLKKMVSRTDEKKNNLGSTRCFIIGFLINSIIAYFYPIYLIPTMLAVIASTGDVAACFIGKLFGKHKIYKKKSLEGFLAYIILAVVSMYIFSGISIWYLLPIGIVGAIIELYSDDYDNLVTQLVCALVAFLIL